MLKTAFLCWLLLVSSGLAQEALVFRTLACRVIDEAGHPVPGVLVRLGGLERDAPDFTWDEPDPRGADWDFTTDQAGRFTARFGRFRAREHEGEYAGPAYGRFHFVVCQPGWAGGISRLVLNSSETELPSFLPSAWQPGDPPPEQEEWQVGEFAPLILRDTPEPRTLDIVLKRGLTLQGRLVDNQGRPIRGREMVLREDLHYGSHTGAGGEIFEQSATTDHSGRFNFRHVYPNRFWLHPSDEGPPIYWAKTRLRHRWTDEAMDEIDPRTGGASHPASYERTLPLRLVVERRRTYRYFGRVTDEQGNSVSGLNISIQPSSRQHPARLYADGEGEGKILTDRQGNYSTQMGWPGVDFICVDDQGLFGRPTVQGQGTLLPGRYDFTVRPKQPGE